MRKKKSIKKTTATTQSTWEKPVFSVDGKSVSTGKLVTGLILFVFAYLIAKKISSLVEKRLISRLPIEDNLKHIWKRVSFYILFFTFVLFILNFLNIPLTIFTVLGGALAIGVGFGSQSLVNNFISGTVILLAKPLRIGDVISVDDLTGRVEFIGARSTRMKTMENTHIVVPNSRLLEKNILNWTLSDNIIRRKLSVGVAYGSDIQKVKNLLDQLIERESRVLAKPRPIVLFNNFGDNSLEFIVYFWARLPYNLIDLDKLASSLRFEIYEVFKQNSIVIAFPQRDVHLNTSTPLQIELKNQ
ncbi:MAG: mechanosensitive ion channel [Bdellovibrionaceae bacterium]|nr:mechanosensitive ion channel [Pseudobdellovibrionaceae bacterium]